MRALTAATVLVMASPGAAWALVGGSPSPQHPEVAALLFDGDRICSGVLVAPRHLATAAHCVDGLPADALGLEAVFDPRGDDPASQGGIAASEILLHPGWTAPERIDVAVVVLAEDAPAEPAGWSGTPPGSEWEFEALTLVGTGDAHPDDDDPWVRSEATVWTEDLSLTHRFWWDDEAALCDRDSGGGVFAEGTSTLLAIATEGDADCAEWGAGIRIDVVASFLADPTSREWGGLSDDDDEVEADDETGDAGPTGGTIELDVPDAEKRRSQAVGCDDGWSGAGWALLPLVLPLSLRPRRRA